MTSAADTNVVVRLITRDDPRQFAKLLPLLAGGGLVLLPTVILETEWILRSVFAYSRKQIDQAFSALLAMDLVAVVDENVVVRALLNYRDGMDFADALHLASAQHCDEFVTFDRNMARRAAAAPTPPAVRLL
ncbi:PIN domain-containing protein [Jiella sonneratiae]|uniref:Type II toxin-antitoxin system VapC family toxin n=1 Tax=Jiella sonneratiae TaxID=2816856 RepID=A0ABS3J6Y8_9HYPH|nr:type II toxin-antitoxin system VapC family toxin [Jiella sonneratiae]